MKNSKLSLLILVFALTSAVFFLLLIFFYNPFLFYPLARWQDALDILTPLVLIPLYWLLFRFSTDYTANLVEEILFMVFAATWVLGHGMHLAANSINNLVGALAKSQGIDIIASEIYTLIYFYDEHLSHYIWHIGILGLTSLLIYRAWRRPAGEATAWWAVVLAGLVYGFTLFCLFIEGQTALLGYPFALIITLLALIWGRKKLAQQPILAFFLIACLAAAALLTAWGVYWTGFPQFTDVGLI